MNNTDLIAECMEECEDPITKKQLAVMLGRQRNPYTSEDDDLNQIISNNRLSEHFKHLARDLDTLTPKDPEHIYKSHLEKNFNQGLNIDSALTNLAKTYVNAFVNAGYGTDNQVMNQDKDSDWVFKNKEEGQIAASASLGMLLLGDIDDGFGGQIDKYMEHTNIDIQAGAFMAYGLINSGITNEMDPVSAVLTEKLVCPEDKLKIGALMGLSFTYAGSTREDLLEEITPIIMDSDNSTELKAVASLTLGLIYVGTCNEDVAQAILQTLMEMEEKEIDNPFSRLFCLGLGLLFLGQQSLAEASMLERRAKICSRLVKFFGLEIVSRTCEQNQ